MPLRGGGGAGAGTAARWLGRRVPRGRGRRGRGQRGGRRGEHGRAVVAGGAPGVYGMVVAGGVAPEGAVAAEVVDVDVYALGVEPLPTP
eukprot:scaffold119794_cov28-Phaeocystis_antarctica.AAC.1